MPFEPNFWNHPQHAKAAAQLDQVKGFITALPIYWTKGENNRFEYPTPLVTDNMLPTSTDPNAAKFSREEGLGSTKAEAIG